MIFDLIVVGSLVVFRPRGIVFQWTVILGEMPDLKCFKRIAIATVAWLLLAVPATYATMSVKKNDLAELGTEFVGADGKKTILLQPEKWLGKELPLFSSFFQSEKIEDLKQGTWYVLLIHTDCSMCLQLMDDLKANNSERIVIVVIPSRRNEQIYRIDFPTFWL